MFLVLPCQQSSTLLQRMLAHPLSRAVPELQGWRAGSLELRAAGVPALHAVKGLGLGWVWIFVMCLVP